jgi:hypothetical protein
MTADFFFQFEDWRTIPLVRGLGILTMKEFHPYLNESHGRAIGDDRNRPDFRSRKPG